ncbi:hypothetical protein FDC58_15060 [Clostridium botulinum]|uniref:Putative deoxyribonucleoside regulator DeoR (Transcriptional repressor) n=1 Tax=Clostridium botulinum TaxID=1491 RepID=A0A0A0UU65_CLOBO|nr:hypothetical protein [Clostridium botulinum]AIW54589.1 putative deoxyribonucleoside regulator DeoR (transcriptional repressor) [Clostridium botulinum]AIW54709.1 putative deoxyribonucleoside regulator DeoR (transcriptional repressor) [Clostridium botulinum]AIW54771.1 putative deoxyribonucleoside regulator DeoR (transcriptional repressor) [Clostridium botulinum]AIW54838.1 putative deoxyribonucleoside regulator DeoR (transcriptional repressor) [Clostridium botulinum]MBY7009289.1 hypothetical p
MSDNEKKEKRNYILSVRKTDTKEFKEFLNSQENFNESMRYLIYKHIAKEGTKNISQDKYFFK